MPSTLISPDSGAQFQELSDRLPCELRRRRRRQNGPEPLRRAPPRQGGAGKPMSRLTTHADGRPARSEAHPTASSAAHGAGSRKINPGQLLCRRRPGGEDSWSAAPPTESTSAGAPCSDRQWLHVRADTTPGSRHSSGHRSSGVRSPRQGSSGSDGEGSPVPPDRCPGAARAAEKWANVGDHGTRGARREQFAPTASLSPRTAERVDCRRDRRVIHTLRAS